MARSSTGRPGVAASPEQQERRETGPLTRRGHARRAALLEAARRVFEDRGFMETRVTDIAAEANVAQGTFYTYFDSKDAIFVAVATRVAGEVIVELGSSNPQGVATYERTYASMKRFVDSYRRNAKILALIEQVGTYTPELRQIRLQVREAGVERMTRIIEHHQRDGLADDSIGAQLTAEALGSMVDQIAHVWFNLGKEFDEQEMLHVLTVLWLRGAGIHGQQGEAPPSGEDRTAAEPATA